MIGASEFSCCNEFLIINHAHPVVVTVCFKQRGTVAAYNVELRQLSLFHGSISHVLRH
jgi:hypothetical protein